MVRACGIVVGVVGLVACGNGDGEKSKPAPVMEGPMPVRFGECAQATVAWVSGPKPLPFTADELNNTKVAANDPPPPPAVPPPPDPAPAPQRRAPRDRQEAIEQARAAGVLGSTALSQGGAFASLTATGDVSSGFDDTNIYGGLLGYEAGEMNGGFGYGRAGFGPGGGVTGWGTIGTGRYGTIGQGSGYGVGGGRGGARGRSAAVPTVSTGQPQAQGDLDKAIIRRYIKRNIQKLQYCYEKELLAKPGLAGTVTTQFFIAPDGQVASASATGLDPEVATCVANAIERIEFPKPKGGGGVQVNYPFTFRPAGAGATPAPSAGSGSAADPAAATATAAAPAPRALLRPPVRGPVDATSYRPGGEHPLRSEESALAQCFRKNAKPYGVAVVELGYDPAGAVINAIVHGIDDAGVRDCVAAAARRVKGAAGAEAQRCSLAFGTMPESELPAIDVTTDALVYGGKRFTTGGDLRTSPGLVTALAAELAPILADNGPIVAIHGPRLVRPLEAAKMRDVNAAIASVISAGSDFVLAARRRADWTLFAPMTLPTIPVPFGTGGRWFPIKAPPGPWASVADDERVDLSVLVEQDQVWIGISRVNEFQQIPMSELATRLADALATHKASAFFADRVDLEIAGGDDATYGKVVEVIDAAVKAGFVGWRFALPQDLSARPQL